MVSRKLIRSRWAAVVLVAVASTGLNAPVVAQPAANKLGPEFQVNTITSSHQTPGDVVTDRFGNFVIAWDSFHAYNAYNVFARRFDASGTALGSEFLVNTNTTRYDTGPSVGIDPAGNFVVAWGGGGSGGANVFARLFDGSGAALSGEILLPENTSDLQMKVSVDMDSAGNFVAAWSSQFEDGDGFGVFARRFDATGAPLDGAFQVNTFFTGDQTLPVVAKDADPAGDFVVVWQSDWQDGYLDGIFAQRFEATGTPLGSEFQVNSATIWNERTPAIAMDPSASFVIAWTNFDGFNDGIAAKRFTASGVDVSGEFLVNTFTEKDQSFPSIGVDPRGHFVVVWDGYAAPPDYADVFGQAFDSSGTPLGGEFLVNSFSTDDQVGASVAVDEAGNFVVAWQSWEQDGELGGIFAQRFLAPCREELPLTANQWYLIGLPCEPQAGKNTVQDVFGDDLGAAGYGFTWTVFERDETTDQYAQLALTDTLTMGVGYWLQTSDSGRTIDVEGHNANYTCDPSSSLVPVGGCVEPPALTGAAGDCQDATLSDGRFNMMGHPFHLSVRWAGALFDDDGTERTTVEAEDQQLASDQVWTWNGAAYQTGDSCTPGMEIFLSEWDGFWIDVCDDDATPLSLRIPARSGNTACGGAPPPPPGAPEKELHFDAAARDLAAGDLATGESMGPGGEPGPGGGGGGKGWKDTWYLRLVASADGLSDPGNVLGELTDSVYGYDSHDLVELQPFGENWLTIVFPHLDWGDDSSEWYTSDYHGLKDPREWRFEVRSSEARTVTLTWAFTGDAKLVEKLERHMELVDLVTGESVPAAVGSYSFTMSGSEHPFAWLGRRGGGPPR